MGHVKIDVDRDNVQWYPVNLSDSSSVKGLIKYRTTYDLLYTRQFDSRAVSESYQDLDQLQDEVICLYIELDESIKNCGLSNRQKEVLEYYMQEYTEEEIANKLNVAPSTINGIINSSCNKISNYNNQKWKNEFLLWNKKKVDTNYKRCSKCKEFLPLNEEYFSSRNDNKSDGFYSYCRKCGNS